MLAAPIHRAIFGHVLVHETHPDSVKLGVKTSEVQTRYRIDLTVTAADTNYDGGPKTGTAQEPIRLLVVSEADLLAEINREEETFATRGFKAIYPADILRGWRDRNRCPENDRLCSEAVWLTQTMLLGPRRDMDDIADAVLRVRTHAAQLIRS